MLLYKQMRAARSRGSRRVSPSIFEGFSDAQTRQCERRVDAAIPASVVAQGYRKFRTGQDQPVSAAREQAFDCLSCRKGSRGAGTRFDSCNRFIDERLYGLVDGQLLELLAQPAAVNARPMRASGRKNGNATAAGSGALQLLPRRFPRGSRCCDPESAAPDARSSARAADRRLPE
jgi:hypothetical protein